MRAITSAPLRIQESLYPKLTCFGCGHANPSGFHLRSYRDGDVTVAEFTPRPEHDNGFGFLNGGIISTVLDCHGAAVVMWEASERGWEAVPGAPVSVDESEIVVGSELEVDGKTRATMYRDLAAVPSPLTPEGVQRNVTNRQGPPVDEERMFVYPRPSLRSRI